MTPGIGHNLGPSMARGAEYRLYQWKKARDAAMPKNIPLMVVKMHAARAKELGLDYATYATLRKATGRGISGLLFSSNALGVLQTDALCMPRARGDVVRGLRNVRKMALVHAPLTADAVLEANPVLDSVALAPRFTDSWGAMRDQLRQFIMTQRLNGDQVLVIGDTAMERDWKATARAAGYLEAGRYFS